MGFISWTIRGGDSSMNEMLGYRAEGWRRMIRSRGTPSYVYTERVGVA